ncbi:hypothetical protein [Streptomyces sp. SHP 1-2]|uniref:hypothetical protein n=1 Tax=Streptomyces sp. SHP 1-2 TaxID=2769489 RepID=UPI002238C15E|nr:hypothetical protein [Streptomyces sp. SHP 1-2]MCW5253017.1 hypothetical protein [Streptomyces sp. SHP 1-2]
MTVYPFLAPLAPALLIVALSTAVLVRRDRRRMAPAADAGCVEGAGRERRLRNPLRRLRRTPRT